MLNNHTTDQLTIAADVLLSLSETMTSNTAAEAADRLRSIIRTELENRVTER